MGLQCWKGIKQSWGWRCGAEKGRSKTEGCSSVLETWVRDTGGSMWHTCGFFMMYFLLLIYILFLTVWSLKSTVWPKANQDKTLKKKKKKERKENPNQHIETTTSVTTKPHHNWTKKQKQQHKTTHAYTHTCIHTHTHTHRQTDTHTQTEKKTAQQQKERMHDKLMEGYDKTLVSVQYWIQSLAWFQV